MSNGFAVETIVAQIRNRIAQEKARKPGPSQAGLPANEGPSWSDGRFRQRLDDDTARFADLDLRLENAARNIGQQPFAPPTWRGRVGGWMVQGLRRILWWYGLPIKESIAQIGFRNREQAIRHRYLREDLLALSETLQTALDRIAGLQHAQVELQGLKPSIADCRKQVDWLTQQTESGLQDLRKSQDTAAEAVAHKLGEMQEDWSRHQQRTAQQIAALNERIEQLKADYDVSESRRTQLGSRVADLEREAAEREKQLPAMEARQESEARAREALAGAVDQLARRLHELDQALGSLGERITADVGRVDGLDHTAGELQRQLAVQENYINVFIREYRAHLIEPLSKVQAFSQAATDSIDALYAAFEDTFRGPRELIKERQAVYIPSLIRAGAGSTSVPVLDLGCGRGEWLELLAERNLVAQGVDSNPGMIERCQAFGIQATLGDALTSLRALPDDSLGAVTSFHMVEHLPFETVIAILEESFRVLQPGGVLILETPNPQNVLVGSCTFWIDPTHVKPIPSQTLRFFVEAHGFRDAEVWNLQPYQAAMRLPEDPAGLGARFNECFYGPQDYGIIARRP
jgi:SAM-dependent methyltransferase/predicted nuclease with TOPRIM domain